MKSARLPVVLRAACERMGYLADRAQQVAVPGDRTRQYLELAPMGRQLLSASGRFLEVREAMWRNLRTFEDRAQGGRAFARPPSAEFVVGRLQLLQSYLVTSWSICDAVCECFYLLCPNPSAFGRTAADVKNRGGLLQILGSEVNAQRAGQAARMPVLRVACERFGYSVCQSYALRNLLVHSPGASHVLFADASPTRPFELSDAGRGVLLEKVNGYEIVPRDDAQKESAWPNPLDVLSLLEAAHAELDWTLVVLCEAAVDAAERVIGFLEDTSPPAE